MSRKFFVRVISIIIALIMVVSVGFTAVSSIAANATEIGQYGYITGADVNVRSGAGTNYSVVTNVSKFTCFSFADSKIYNSNWYKIKILSSSKIGYVHKDYIKAATTTTGCINKNNTPILRDPGTNFSEITKLSANTNVGLVSTTPKNNYYYVISSNGKLGYVQSSNITKNSQTSSDTQYGYLNASDVCFRPEPNIYCNVITTLGKFTCFELVDSKLYNSNWYKVKLLSDNRIGYIYKTYAALSLAESGYINADNVPIRRGAGTSYSSIMSLSKNTKVCYVNKTLHNKEWYYVISSNGKLGYVQKKYISSSASQEPATQPTVKPTEPPKTDYEQYGYLNASDVYLRKEASINCSIISTLGRFTCFAFVDSKLYNSGWYKVRTLSDNKVGYVYKTYVEPATDTVGYINADNVPIRRGAGTSNSVIVNLKKGIQICFVDNNLHNNDWYYVISSNGKLGYVHKNSITKYSQKAVTNVVKNSLKMYDTSETIYKGNKYVLYVTGTNSKLSWKSSDTNIATVDSNGIVTAKNSGTATITASADSQSVSAKITVKSGSTVNINMNSATLSATKSIRLSSSTSDVKWKSSNDEYATVSNGIVDTIKKGYVTITAYTSYGAATCLVKIDPRDDVRYTYTSENSAPLNSTVTFYAITDTERTGVKFEVSKGSTKYTLTADNKVKDGKNYIWSASKKITSQGEWTVTSYAEYKNSGKFTSTAKSWNNKATFIVNSTSDTKSTDCKERRASKNAIDLIADYEGFLSSITADVITGDPTIGYGKVIYKSEEFYNNITENEAYAYLVSEVNDGGYTSKLNSFLVNNSISFNQRQFDALIIFLYNVGASAINNDSTLQSVLLNTGSSGTATIKSGAAGYVNAGSVNLRSGAGTSYSVVKTMAYNTKFTFQSANLYNSNWYKIKLTDGTVGYIYSDYASVVSSGGTRNLDKVGKQTYANAFFPYHHASGSCYWGLLYRRVDEGEVFFYGDYKRDGQNNKNNFSYNCTSYGGVWL